MNIHLGGEIHRLHNLLCRDCNRFPSGELVDRMTGSHGFILGWLREHRDEDVFQKDLEKRFQLRRSSATATLQMMERNGLVLREPVASDARLKKLVLTEKSEQLCNMIHADIEENERRLVEGISPEELTAALATLQKVRANLERGLYSQTVSPAEGEAVQTSEGKEGTETT